jgi:membrane-associated protease RseP (regulator of RpoE activity)
MHLIDHLSLFPGVEMKKRVFLVGCFIIACLLPFLLLGFSDSPAKSSRYKEVAWLGIATQNLTPQLRSFFGAEANTGVLISEVIAESPAEKHGFKAGDVIMQIDGEMISESAGIEKIIQEFDPGESVSIIFLRDRQEKEVTVVLGGRERRMHPYFGHHPDKMEIVVPEIDIDLPEMKFEIPEFDEEELENLQQQVQEEIRLYHKELKENLEELKEKLQEMKIQVKHQSFEVI